MLTTCLNRRRLSSDLADSVCLSSATSMAPSKNCSSSSRCTFLALPCSHLRWMRLYGVGRVSLTSTAELGGWTSLASATVSTFVLSRALGFGWAGID